VTVVPPVAPFAVRSGYGATRPGGNHWGVDLPGRAGQVVRTPESGIVVAIERGAGTSIALRPPFDGYGPGAVLIHGDSGVWHLLAHVKLLPVGLMVGSQVEAGAVVGVMPRAVGKAGPHTHWEVRVHKPIDSPRDRHANTIDPKAWLLASAAQTGGGLVDIAQRVKARVVAHETARIGGLLFLLWLVLRRR